MDYRRLLRRGGLTTTPLQKFWQAGSLDGVTDPSIPNLPLFTVSALALTAAAGSYAITGTAATLVYTSTALALTSHAANDSGNGGGSGYGTGTYTTPSFTSNSSSLLVIAVKGVDQGIDTNSIEAAMTVSDSNGGTWTKRIGSHSLTSDNDFVVWWTSPVTTGASTTITVGSGGGHNVYRYIVEIYSFTGYDVASPVGGTVGTGSASGSTPYTQTLSATPAATSYIMAGCISDGGSSTETVGTGWTGLYSAAPDIKYLSEYITGSTSTTVTWNALTNVSGSGCSSAALEIKKASSSAISLIASAGSYTLTGSTASLLKSRLLTAASGSYSLTGTAATLRKGFAVTAAAGSYSLTGQPATLLQTQLLSAAAGSYSLTGSAAGLLHGWRLSAGAGSYSITGQDATLSYAGSVRTLAAASGSYTLTGSSATLFRGLLLSATSPGSYVLTGANADLSFGIAIGAGSYSIAGQSASLLQTQLLTAASGSYTITGQAATLTLLANKTLTAEAGSYSISGQAATLTYSGAPPSSGANDYLIRKRRRRDG